MFYIHTVDDGRNPPHEYLAAAASLTPKAGMALKLNEGKLETATAADEVAYISMCEREAACADGELIPVIRAGHDIIFETTAQAALSSVNVGDKVQLHTDGMQVTATKNGAAEIVYKDGDKAGDMVRVRFGPVTAASEAA